MLETIGTLTQFCPDFEIVVVDDGSPDGTYLPAVEALAELGDNIRVVRYARNVGKGNALICGFYHTHGDLVAFLDADMDLHPEQIRGMIEILEARGADVVIGSKWHRNSVINYPLVRRLWSMGYYFLVRLLFGLRCLRLEVRDACDRLPPMGRKFVCACLPLVGVFRVGFPMPIGKPDVLEALRFD